MENFKFQDPGKEDATQSKEEGLKQKLGQPSSNERKELEPQVSEQLVRALTAFKDKFNPSANIIYYPCSATDASLSVAFPDSRVIYVDIDKNAVESLRKAGLEAHEASVFEFSPDQPVDILFTLNPSVPIDKPLESVKPEGYILCNDYNSTATQMQGDPTFHLEGVVITDSSGNEVVDTEQLQEYWEEVETDEEFQRAPFSWGATNYEMAKQIVKRLKGKEGNILREYKQIVEEAKEKAKRERDEIIKEEPELFAGFDLADSDEVMLIRHGDDTFVIDARLPKKKGTVDNIFVYKKNSEQEQVK